MPLSYQIRDKEASINISGHFNFSLHSDFRAACQAVIADPEVKSVDINLQDTEYLDSSALGMLLVLREQLAPRDIKLMITNSRASIRQILTIARFEKFFQID
ncbi:STAS domain-containing protein [Vogesella oryzae]|uniref:STAS domain-containing protein n=1 Tax=Vogesella oryzae TaxID=1735285 RepID=UPI0015827BA9|nr:STAS domain-containing protein [Vogesella oryzae]